MGVYDTVRVPCPVCGELEDFQSKSGECLLDYFTLENCPLDVLYDVNRHSPHVCGKCGQYFAVDREKRKSIKAERVDWTEYGVGSYEAMREQHD